jgi:hypothetical protein
MPSRPGGFTPVKAKCCAGGGGHCKLYGCGSPLRMEDISLAKSIQLWEETLTGDMHSPLYRVR